MRRPVGEPVPITRLIGLNPQVGSQKGNAPSSLASMIEYRQRLGAQTRPADQLFFLDRKVVVVAGIEDRRKGRRTGLQVATRLTLRLTQAMIWYALTRTLSPRTKAMSSLSEKGKRRRMVAMRGF